MAILKVINEVATLVESSLGLPEPLLTNDYNYWTQDPSGSWDVIPPTSAVFRSENDEFEHDGIISKSFTIENPAERALLTVTGSRDVDHPSYGGEVLAEIILVKPNSTEVSLYWGEGDTNVTITYLNALDIRAHLNLAGTYTLQFRVTAVSGVVHSEGSSTYYISSATFNAVTLDIDVTKPSQVTYFTGNPSGLNTVQLLWTAAARANYYKIYYKKPSDSTWLYRTTYDLNTTITPLDAGTFYDFYIVGVNFAGEGPVSTTIQLRPWGIFTQELGDTTTPLEELIGNRGRSITFTETLPHTETFNTQKLSVAPASSVLLICGVPTGVYTFESGLLQGYYDTPEIHFGYPDKEKILSEIRFGSESSNPHTIVVYVSVNGGSTWTLIGSDTTGLGVIGFVYPWLTATRFIIRFFGGGLHLYYYEAYAIPTGWRIKNT